MIELGGHDVRDLSLGALRDRIALVRGAEVFPGCILDNLRAAKSGLSAEDAWKALARVGIAETVKSLPKGLQTPLSRDGAPLSRTEVVALTIARALAGKPSLLILDRTLDRIDPRAGARIAESLSEGHATALLIVSEDPAIQARMDEHIEISEPIEHEGAAA